MSQTTCSRPGDTRTIYQVMDTELHIDYYKIHISAVAGTAYLMGRSTAAALYNASLDTPLFHLEDIFVTGILASKVHIR